MTTSLVWRLRGWLASTPSSTAAQPVDMGRAVWFGKPAGTSYAEFYDQLASAIPLWRRQMVLGPTPEFCSIDDDEVPDGAVVVTRLRTVAASAA